jgi:hypothetical protein
MLVCLGAAAPAKAVPRFAVPGGNSAGASCMNPGDNCSLEHVLETVVQTGDEVIVTPGTYDLVSNVVTVKSGTSSLNIHGQDGQPRPRVTTTSGQATFAMCALSSCPGNGTTLRRLAIDNQGTGGGLVVWGGAVGTPLTIDDVQVVAGSESQAILLFSQTNVTTEAVIRNTTARSTNPGANGNAIASLVNLTLRNVTAVASGAGANGLQQSGNCVPGECTGNGNATVVNSVLQGGPNGFDVRAISPSAACPTCFGIVSLDYSNFDSVLSCTGCSASAPGSASNQTTPPLLVNQAAGDFHQVPGSPTIDAGVNNPANGTTDPDGNPRQLGTATDIGAFEDGHARAVTGAPTNLTDTGGTLQGSVNPVGFATTYQFQWGPTTAYGNQTPALPASVGSGSTPQAVSQSIGGLTPGTTVHYRVVATNSFGTAFGNDQSFVTLIPFRPGDRTAPTISGLALSNTRFRVAPGATPVSARARRVPLGTTFRYSLSERARVTITIERARPGRRVGRRCVRPTRSNRRRRRCTRYVRAGALTRRNQGPGRVRTRFSGRIGRRKLAPGRYRATLGATDAAGNRAAVRRVSFTIVR